MSRPWLGWSLFAALLAAGCSPQPPSPPPSPQPPSPPPPSAAAVDSSGNHPGPPPSASAPEPLPPSALRPYRGAMLADDAGTVFPARARLAGRSPIKVRLDEAEEALSPSSRAGFVPLEVVVVERREGWVRLIHESDGCRLLLWAGHEALERAPARLTRLALKPGVFPDQPGEDSPAGTIGVFVVPGQRLEAKKRQGSWIAVDVGDMGFRATGWLDESAFEPVWTPQPVETSARAGAGVYTGSRLLAWPGGPAVGDFPIQPGEGRQVHRWVERVGMAPAGFVRVRFTGFTLLAEGFVPEASFVPPSGGGFGRGRGGRLSVKFGDPKVKPAFSLPPGTDLFDGPDGELVGRVTQKAWVPDRVGARVERGRRLVEVPSGQLGLVKVWVDEASLSPYEPPPPSK